MTSCKKRVVCKKIQDWCFPLNRAAKCAHLPWCKDKDHCDWSTTNWATFSSLMNVEFIWRVIPCVLQSGRSKTHAMNREKKICETHRYIDGSHRRTERHRSEWIYQPAHFYQCNYQYWNIQRWYFLIFW